MNTEIDTDEYELLSKKVTELYVFIEYLILYMIKQNIIDKNDFYKNMGVSVDESHENDLNLESNKLNDMTMIKFKDSIFKFDNTGES